MFSRAARWAKMSIAFFFSTIALYLGFAVLFGAIPENADFIEPNPQVMIYVRSNGIHADIVLPYTTPDFDWRQEFPRPAGLERATFIAFGWGDRGFYIETPEWKDIRLSTALTAISGIGQSTMHVGFAGPPHPARNETALWLSNERYLKLVAFIRSSFQRDSLGSIIPIPVARNTFGARFYEAKGRYSLFYTCNGWVRNALATIGVRVPFWAPFDSALFYHLKRITPARL